MTFAISTILKNEHDYINQFIDYHLKLGFTFFYIMIDNIYYEQDSYENYISEEYKQYIKFYYITREYDLIKYKLIIENNNYDTNQYWIDFFNDNVLNEIKEKWVLIIGCDSFMYFNSKTVNNFIIDNNFSEDISQILFFWFVVRNLDNISNSNLINNLNKMYTEVSSNHCYTMGKISKIEKLITGSHCFSSKTEKQKIYICDDKYRMFGKNILSSDIFQHTIFDKYDENRPKIFCSI